MKSSINYSIKYTFVGMQTLRKGVEAPLYNIMTPWHSHYHSTIVLRRDMVKDNDIVIGGPLRKMQCKDVSEQEIIDACNQYAQEVNIWLLDNPTAKPRPKDPVTFLVDKYPDFSGQPENVILTKMEKMADKGILEYGVSVRYAWVLKTPGDH